MIRFLCVLLTIPLLSACAESERVTIRVGSVPAEVELALTPKQRMQGLMGRETLAPGTGMLLVYPQQKVLQLWMLNTKIPLDAGFFDNNGVLINHLSMLPDGGRGTYASLRPATYALEMNLGWFERHGLKAGDQLFLPRLLEAY